MACDGSPALVPSLASSPAAWEKEAKTKGTAGLEFIEDITRNAAAVQERVLNEILITNSETEYLKRFQLHGAAVDQETFKLKVPVITYEDIRPDIKRIADGDKYPILCAHSITEFLSSSGTSGGEPKLIPMTQEDWDRRHLYYYLRFYELLNFHWPGLDQGKGLYFLFVKPESRTPSGLIARSVTTSYFNSDEFKNNILPQFTSPIEAILCPDSFQSMYVQLLFGLIMRQQVLRIGDSAPGVIRVIQFLQENLEQLAEDIETGTLSPQINHTALRESMAKILTADQELAEFISRECSGGNLEGIIRRIWPNTIFIHATVTGSMAQYISSLEHFSGGLPLVSPSYAGSECHFALNLNPKCKPYDISYTLMPNVAYFEFLPHGEDDRQGKHSLQHRLVKLADVEVGKEYELVITTYTGLYRYRVGDILRVTGLYNSAPLFRFVKRDNVFLSIDFDKTDEADLLKANQSASSLLQEFNSSLVDYTSHADAKTVPGHYVIYWELHVKDRTNPPNDEVMNRCCLAMEESLSAVYRRLRVASKSIGPLEIRVVENGTFKKLLDYVVSKGNTSITQYKVPRCVSSRSPILELLNSRVVSNHFSPSVPHWNSSVSI